MRKVNIRVKYTHNLLVNKINTNKNLKISSVLMRREKIMTLLWEES